MDDLSVLEDEDLLLLANTTDDFSEGGSYSGSGYIEYAVAAVRYEETTDTTFLPLEKHVDVSTSDIAYVATTAIETSSTPAPSTTAENVISTTLGPDRVSLARFVTDSATRHTIIDDVTDNFGTLLASLSTDDSPITRLTTAVPTSFANATNGTGTGAAEEHHVYSYCQSEEGMVKCGLLFQITYGVILPTICFIGLIGNALNLPVVIKRSRKAQMYRYLTWMSVSDMCTATFALIFCIKFGWEMDLVRSYSGAFFFIQVLFYLLNVFLVSSTLLVVTITIERFAAIAIPLRAKTLFTRRSSYIFICLAYVLPLLFFSVDWFSKEVETVFSPTSNRVVYYENPTEFASSGVYKAFMWLHVFLFKFLTIIIIVIMNTATIIIYNLSMKRRKALVSSGGGGHRGPADRAADSRNRDLMALLITVVVIYVICLTPMAIKFVLDSDRMFTYFSYHVFTAVANSLEVMNGAINFYFYCLSSRDYRKGFRSVIISPIEAWARKHFGFLKRDHATTSPWRMLRPSTSRTTSTSTCYTQQTSCVSEPLDLREAGEPTAAAAPLLQQQENGEPEVARRQAANRKDSRANSSSNVLKRRSSRLHSFGGGDSDGLLDTGSGNVQILRMRVTSEYGDNNVIEYTQEV